MRALFCDLNSISRVWRGRSSIDSPMRIGVAILCIAVLSGCGGGGGSGPTGSGSSSGASGSSSSSSGSGSSSSGGTTAGLNTLYTFSGASDGGDPEFGVVLSSDGNLYGSTYLGGNANAPQGLGTLFVVSPGGSFRSLHQFSGQSDGGAPGAGLVSGGNGNLFGTTSCCGSGKGDGTAFSVSGSSGPNTLYTFTDGADGGEPQASLVLGTDGNFYGTTYVGGANGYGTIFKLTSSGALTTLYSFTGSSSGYPKARLLQANDGNLYGVTSGDNGTVFQLKLAPSVEFTTLYTFTGKADGADPSAALVQGLDGNLYGTTSGSTTNGGEGTIYKITTSGQLTTLYTFAVTPGVSDGGRPESPLVQASDGTFYGTTIAGDVSGIYGTIFKMGSTGSLLTLYSFTGGSDGAYPLGDLAISNGTLFGTTAGCASTSKCGATQGGSSNGTVYGYLLPQ